MKEKYRFKNGKIIIDMYRDKDYSPKNHIVTLYGLLSSPLGPYNNATNILIKNGFTVWCPHYEGTFASDGVCTFDNAVGSVIKTIQLIEKRKATSLFSNTETTWNKDKIVVVGSSFGGSIALVAAGKSRKINKVVSLAGPTDYRMHKNIFSYYPRWKKGWQNTWRTNRTFWQKFAKGNLDLNAINYAKLLLSKNVVLVHDKGDKQVDFRQSKILYEAIKNGPGQHKLVAFNNGIHFSTDDFGNKRILKEIMLLASSI